MNPEIINTINKILTAMNNNQNKIELLQKFANSQSILKEYGYRNVLLLTRQAFINKMQLSDVRTIDEWAKLNISPSTFSQPLIMVRSIVKDGKIITQEEKAYDISHTNATEQGVIPIETIAKAEDGNYSNVYENLLSYVRDNFDISINDSKDIVTNGYYPYSQTITINKAHNPIQNIQHLINKLYIDTVYGEQIRDYSRIVQDDTIESAISKIITNSFLNRISINSEMAGNKLTSNEEQLLYENLPNTLEAISENIRKFDKKLQISQFINTNFNVHDELYRHQEEFAEKIKKIEKPHYNPKKKIEWIKMSEEEANYLRDKTTDEIISADPSPILDTLQLYVKSENPSKYQFKARAENSASAYMSLKNGVWLYKDFGGSGKGTVLNLAQEVLNLNWKEARQMCCDILGARDYWQIRQDEIKYENELKMINAGIKAVEPTQKPKKTTQELLEESEEKLKALKQANLELEKLHSVNSKVTYASKNIPARFIKWLKEERGILDNQLKGFYYIKGETWQYDEDDNVIDIKKKDGVGVLCANQAELDNIINQIEAKGLIEFNFDYSQEQTIGADVHFPPYSFVNDKGEEVTMKTQSFGAKKNSTFINNNGNSAAVIESKMDYAAAAQQINFQQSKINVDIANSVGNADMIADNIVQNKPSQVIFLNQFDAAGVRFIIDVVRKAKEQGYEIDKFSYIDYAKSEYKQDINDLVKNGIQLEDRTKTGTLKDLAKMLDKIGQVEQAEDKLKEINKIKEYLASCTMQEQGGAVKSAGLKS